MDIDREIKHLRVSEWGFLILSWLSAFCFLYFDKALPILFLGLIFNLNFWMLGKARKSLIIKKILQEGF